LRHASAISLLAAICLSLIAPAVFAGAETNLPACCRRNGAHHCAMATDDSISATQTSFQPVKPCPSFPVGAAVSGGSVAFLGDSTTNFALTVSHPSKRLQPQAFYRISFSRSCRQRGPPAILS
jgi:hypothetical protein